MQELSLKGMDGKPRSTLQDPERTDKYKCSPIRGSNNLKQGEVSLTFCTGKTVSLQVLAYNVSRIFGSSLLNQPTGDSGNPMRRQKSTLDGMALETSMIRQEMSGKKESP